MNENKSDNSATNKNKSYILISLRIDTSAVQFGKIHNGEIILNEYGKIIEVEWQNLADRYPVMEIDEYIIMPDHFHAIVVLENDLAIPLRRIISYFKQASSEKLYKYGIEDFKWKKSYFEKKINSEEELNKTREYIFYNPLNAEG